MRASCGCSLPGWRVSIFFFAVSSPQTCRSLFTVFSEADFTVNSVLEIASKKNRPQAVAVFKTAAALDARWSVQLPASDRSSIIRPSEKHPEYNPNCKESHQRCPPSATAAATGRHGRAEAESPTISDNETATTATSGSTGQGLHTVQVREGFT